MGRAGRGFAKSVMFVFGLWLALKVEWDAFFEGSVFLAGVGQPALHVGGDIRMSVGEAVGLVDVVDGVVELLVLRGAEGDDVAALIGLIDVLPLLGANGDDFFVVEEGELVVG